MKKTVAILLTLLILSSCASAMAAPYPYTDKEEDELNSFLEWFQLFGEYSAADATKENGVNIFESLFCEPQSVDYSIYPIKQPVMYLQKDPLKQWDYGVTQTSLDSVDWITNHIIHIPAKDLAEMKKDMYDISKHISQDYWYFYDGSFYSFCAGIGTGPGVDVLDINKDSYYYRVINGWYPYGDFEGTYYSLFTKEIVDGKEYWKIFYNGSVEPASGMPFLDVPSNAYYKEAVRWALKNQVTTGTSDLSFGPNQDCTRAQAVTFLWKASGSPLPASEQSPFQDVRRADYFYLPVLWAAENNIVTGTGPDQFSPDLPCNRAQIVTLLHRSAGSPVTKQDGNRFRDVSSGQYYSQPVKWAVENKITSGINESEFAPLMTCSRAQIITLLHRYTTSGNQNNSTTDPSLAWKGSYRMDNGQIFTVTDVTEEGIQATIQTDDGKQGSKKEEKKQLLFENEERTVVSELVTVDTGTIYAYPPPKYGIGGCKKYYVLRGDRILMNCYLEDWGERHVFSRIN